MGERMNGEGRLKRMVVCLSEFCSDSPDLKSSDWFLFGGYYREIYAEISTQKPQSSCYVTGARNQRLERYRECLRTELPFGSLRENIHHPTGG